MALTEYHTIGCLLDRWWCRGKCTSTYSAAANLVMAILSCLLINLTRTQGVE